MIALQRDRWILWLPVGMIAGAAAWMLAPADPPVWLGGALFALGAIAAAILALWPSMHAGVWLTLRRVLSALCALVAAAGLGAFAAQIRTASVNQPAYAASVEPVRVEGWVVANDASDNGPRLRLLVRSIEGVDAPPVMSDCRSAMPGC